MHNICLNWLLTVVLCLPCFAHSEMERTIERLDTPFCVRNQGGTSTCWMHASVMMMDQAAGSPLSIDALLLPEIRSRALDRYLGHETPWDGGAGPTRPYALALEHGLVPHEIWQAKAPVVQNYSSIFREIEELLKRAPQEKSAFLEEVDKILIQFVGPLPPSEFTWQGQRWTAVEYARAIIGNGDSVGYDFRNIPYSDAVYGRMPEVAWTTIIGRDGELKKITDIIKKTTVRLNADQAFDKAVEIFEAKRPVAFTFIYGDADGRRVVGLNQRQEYVATRPAVTDAYTSSHLVLIKGLVREGKTVQAFEILDPLGRTEKLGTRYITREFFSTHGKTVHEISPTCLTWLTK